MQDPLRAPFVFSYYLGYRTVADVSRNCPASRTESFDCLYGRMHSARSLSVAADLSAPNGDASEVEHHV
jgi:hypothetical protein